MKHVYPKLSFLFLAFILLSANRIFAQCSMPSGFLISNITATGAEFSWNAAPGALSYQGEISPYSTPPFSGTTLTSNGATASMLTPGSLYYVHIRTNCNSGNSQWLTSSFTTLGWSSCQAPLTIMISGVTPTSANYSWNAVSGAVNYEAGITNDPTPPISGQTINGTGAYSSTLVGNTLYYIHIRSYCSSTGYSAWTTQVFKTPASGQSCQIPGNIHPFGLTGTSAVFSWNAVAGVAGYQYVFDQNANDPTTAGTPTTATTASTSGLTPNTNYYLHLRTYCGGAEYSNWSATPFTTGSSCNAPAGFAVNSVTSSTADISWNVVSGVSGYEYAYTSSATPPASGNPISGTSVKLSGLNAGATYYAHVRANCSGTDFSTWTSKSLFTQFPASVSSVNNGNSISVYPNPVTDMVTIKTTGTTTGKASIVITDMTGQVVRQAEVSRNVSTINMTGLASGVYTLKYTDDTHTQTAPIIKQ